MIDSMAGGKLRALRGVVVLCLMANAGAAADLSLPAQTSGPGTSVLLPAQFDPGADLIGGIQFDLAYDNSAMGLQWIPGDALRLAGKSIYTNSLTTNTTRFLVIGTDSSPIPAGPLLNLFVNLSPGASGTYFLTISNLAVTTTSGNTTAATGLNGVVTVQGVTGSRIRAAGVLNAASLSSGPVAPGEIVTLIGSAIGPPIAQTPAFSVTSTTLGAVSVLFDGSAAPLLYASSGQINAIVPFAVSSEAVTQVSIMNGAELVAGFTLPVAESAPGIFTVGSGIGPGAILNQDGTVNSSFNPASAGSIVALFGTGAGTMVPLPADGQLVDGESRLSLPVSVQIGGVDAQVIYAGGAPGLVAGVLQINCAVPQNAPSGNAVPVQLTVGGQVSPLGVFLAVR